MNICTKPFSFIIVFFPGIRGFDVAMVYLLTVRVTLFLYVYGKS